MSVLLGFRSEPRHDDELQQITHCSRSGRSIFGAIRPGLVAVVSLGNSNSSFADLSAKLFNKGASDQYIGKAPTIIKSASPSSNPTSMSRLNVSRLMELHYSPAQFDIESVSNDGKLNDIRMFNLVGRRFTAATHMSPSAVPSWPREKLIALSVSRSDCRHTMAVCLSATCGAPLTSCGTFRSFGAQKRL